MTDPHHMALPADCLPGESVVALYFSDRKPLAGAAALLDWRLDGQLTRMLLDGDVKGRAGEHVMLQNNGKLKAERVLFVGGGKWHGLCPETHAALVGHVLKVIRQAGLKKVSLALDPHADINPEMLRQQIRVALAAEGTGIETCHYACEMQVSA